MRVFVTGGSGWIGSHVVPELIAAGHEVTGLARSDASADTLTAAGAQVRRGDLLDLDALRAGAAEADGVIHLAFIHDFSAMHDAAAVDRTAIEAIADRLEGTGRPFMIASGTLGLPLGRVGTEQDGFNLSGPVSGRMANGQYTLGLTERGIRPSVVRLTPTVHGTRDHGFMALIVQIARQKGVSGYVGDGASHWPAVHVTDAAQVFTLGLDKLAHDDTISGRPLHAVAETGIPTREIAEAIARKLAIPTASITPDDAADHFGFLGALLQMDNLATSTLTQEWLGWKPTGPTLIEDIEGDAYVV